MENNPASSEKRPEVRVFVGGLAPEWDDNDFAHVMSYFGTVLSAQIKRFPGGPSKKFGFAVLTNVKDPKNLYRHHIIDDGKEIEIQEHKKQNSVLLSYSPDSGLNDGEIISWFRSKGFSINNIDHPYRKGLNGYPRANFSEESCISNLLHQGFVYIKNVRVDILSRSTDRKLAYRNLQGPGFVHSNAHYQDSSNLYYEQDQYYEPTNPAQFNQPGMNYKSQDPTRSGPHEQFLYGNKLAPPSTNKKQQQPQGRHTGPKGVHPQNILYTQEPYQEFEEHQANYGSKWSSKQDLSATDYPISSSELRSPQARKPGDSEPGMQTGLLKRASGSKKDPLSVDAAAKHGPPSLPYPLSISEIATDSTTVASELTNSRPLKASGRPEQVISQPPMSESGQGSSLKTPSSKTRGQLSSKNNSDFYPNGPQGSMPAYVPDSGFDGSAKRPITWLPSSQVVGQNNLQSWPQNGEFVRPDLAAAQSLGFMMSPYVYSPAAGMQQFPTPLFFEESISPLEPAKRREWSISYYAFPGLV